MPDLESSVYSISQKSTADLHVSLPFLVLTEVARVVQSDPLHLRDAFEPGLDSKILHLVILPVDKKDRDSDTVSFS